jgi:hypothetical protein
MMGIFGVHMRIVCASSILQARSPSPNHEVHVNINEHLGRPRRILLSTRRLHTEVSTRHDTLRESVDHHPRNVSLNVSSREASSRTHRIATTHRRPPTSARRPLGHKRRRHNNSNKLLHSYTANASLYEPMATPAIAKQHNDCE